MTIRSQITALAFWTVGAAGGFSADEKRVTVDLDVSEVPELADWGEEAKALILAWHPRVVNLIPTKGNQPTTKVFLKLKKSDQGIGATAGNRITISSHWIEKHPDDLGLVFHELVHVIQRYPDGRPMWLTEGIADYLRWGIYEGKPLSWFPRPNETEGYKKGYQVCGGFLLWLESDRVPGMVKTLNTAMRNGKYTDDLFEKEAGLPLDALWDAYVAR